MKFGQLTLNWFDLLLLSLLVFGVLRGRRRGMSEELLDVLQWLTIIVVCSLVYDPLGRIIAAASGMSLFYGYVVAYIFTAIMLKLGFTSIKRMVGEKLVHSDAFGNFEYYFGMMAGAFRFFCILLFAMSLLHAKHISDAERAATARMQAENFGSISFPTIGSLQYAVFHESLSGNFISRHLDEQLMKPVPSGAPRGDTIARRREAMVEEVMRTR